MKSASDCTGRQGGLSRNSVRAFVLGTTVDIGDLTALRIWHDCRGRSPDWFLHRITIENLSTGDVYFFHCDKVRGVCVMKVSDALF